MSLFSPLLQRYSCILLLIIRDVAQTVEACVRCGIDARASARRGAAGKARADCEITNLTKPDRERTGVRAARYWKLRGRANVSFNSVSSALARPRRNNPKRGNVYVTTREIIGRFISTTTGIQAEISRNTSSS